MRAVRMGMVVALALVVSIACGKSEEQIAAEKAAEETREAADALKKAAESAGAGGAQGLNEFAKAMEDVAGALGGKTPDGKAVEPVRFQDLQAALPEMSGWQRGEPTGERMTAPVPFSQAEADYTMGDANISVKVVDSAFSQMLIAPWAMFLTAGYERESSEGYEKAITIGGNPGFERYNKTSRDGELNVVLGKRFLLTIEGDNIDSTQVLHEFAAKLDAAKLEALK